MPAFIDRNSCRPRQLAFGLLLLALPACGLSNYEELMRSSKQREERFRNEQKYLDEPVQMPTTEKDGKQVPVANVFFRPPKGIGAKPESEPRDGLLWRYSARARGGEFAHVEMAFGVNNEDFTTEVLRKYQAEDSFKAPPRDSSWLFNAWEFNDAQNGYSINITKSGRTQVAIVFVFGKSRHGALRAAMDLSLQSLAADDKLPEARQRYKKKSPWRLQPTPAP